MTLVVKMKPMPRGAKRLAPHADDLELRRWCIEQAIRWPVEHGVVGYAVSSMPKPTVEADVIGRATKLLNWVTASK